MSFDLKKEEKNFSAHPQHNTKINLSEEKLKTGSNK